MKIAVLLTCHNRKEKTKKCLASLNNALNSYNTKVEEKVSVEIFLTDDGCTDGTVEAARELFPDENVLHILNGDGSLYWAGGMRFCWNEAKKRHFEWDYYLLLNDDVELMDNLFDELFSTKEYNKMHFGKEGLCSGNTCWRDNPNKRSYGGRVWVSRFWATHRPLEPTGEPQLCDLVNANILLVPKEVVDKIGVLYKGFRHSEADYDYGIMARKAGFPVVVTAHFCGIADNDHVDHNKDVSVKVMSMSLKERKEWFENPIHSDADYLCFISRTSPLRYPIVWLGGVLRIYCPKFYYKLNGVRK